MASLPNPEPTWVPMTATELLAIRGTPEFEVEYRRQLAAVAEHDRKTGNAERLPIDWEWLDKVWK
jgi:hypothetical protein